MADNISDGLGRPQDKGFGQDGSGDGPPKGEGNSVLALLFPFWESGTWRLRDFFAPCGWSDVSGILRLDGLITCWTPTNRFLSPCRRSFMLGTLDAVRVSGYRAACAFCALCAVGILSRSGCGQARASPAPPETRMAVSLGRAGG